MVTTLRIIRLLVPVLVFFGLFSTSCKKDDDSNNNTSCSNQGNLDYGKCITCVYLISYSNGLPAYTYTGIFCPDDFSSQAAFRAYITAACSYDGYTGQGSGYTFSYSVNCRN